MSAPTIVDPSACTWCAIARRGHGRQFADAVGWHEWAAPSQEQILARMKARRLALTVARVGALPMSVGNAESARPNGITRRIAPTQALRADGVYPQGSAPRVQQKPREDPHDSPLHHSYRVGRDLPEQGGA